MESRDQQSFAEHFIRFQRRIYGYVLTIVAHPSDADDIFQETSLILWKKAGEFDPARADFVRWACGIAHNVVRNHRVKRLRDRHLFSSEMMDRIAAAHQDGAVALNQRNQELTHCVEALPGDDRQLLDLCYSGDQNVDQIAAQLGRKPNALYQKLHRIRKALLDCIRRRTSGEASA